MKFKSKLPYSIDDMINVKMNADAEFINLVHDLKELLKRQPVSVDGVSRESKLFFAYLDKDISSMHQYMVIVKQKIRAVTRIQTMFALLPVIRFGDLCLEKYYLAKRDGLEGTFLKDFFEQPIILPEHAFAAFVEDNCELVFDPNKKEDPKYWKKAENAHIMLSKLEDLGKINFNVLRRSK